MPQRGRPVPHEAVRHRARRPAARSPARRPGHAGRDAARLPDGQGALGRGLVDPSAARAVAGVRRPRRRGPRRAARGARRRAGRGRQGRLGRRGVRVAQDLHPDGPRRPVAAYVGPAQGARPPGPGRRARPVDDARPDRGRARRDPEPDHPGLRDRGGRARDAHHPHGPEGHQGLLRPRRRPVRRPLGRRADPGARPSRGPAADADAALRRAAAAARLGRQGPGRRPASAAGPRGDHRHVGGAEGSRREPAHARLRAPRAVDPAVVARPRAAHPGDLGRAARHGRARVAGTADRTAAGRRRARGRRGPPEPATEPATESGSDPTLPSPESASSSPD